MPRNKRGEDINIGDFVLARGHKDSTLPRKVLNIVFKNIGGNNSYYAMELSEPHCPHCLLPIKRKSAKTTYPLEWCKLYKGREIK